MERMIKSAVRLITRQSAAGKAQLKRHILYLILRLQSLDDKHLSQSTTLRRKILIHSENASNVFRLHYAPQKFKLCLRKT